MSRAGLLGVPLGGAGSGRQRYAKAMALYQSGGLSPEQLEAYRIAAACDVEPPAQVFTERGVALPQVPPAQSPSDAIALLLDEMALYLQSLPGPGIDEVRQGMARFRGGPVFAAETKANKVAAAHLPTALAALSLTHPNIANAIRDAAGHLNWITFDLYPPDQIGPDFANGHAYASILGEDAVIAAQDFDLGLFLIAPHVLYRDHNHAAPELYAPLTGPHGWRFGPEAALMIKPAHEPVWNPPHQAHLTKVGPTPFLCLFCWTRDVQAPAHVIPATDWPALEAMRLAP